MATDNGYCEDCAHPRSLITQANTPLQPQHINTGAALRCGVCGSARVREIPDPASNFVVALSADDREELRGLVGRAAYHQAAMWDAMREMEGVLGAAIDHSKPFQQLAGELDVPADENNLPDDMALDGVLASIAEEIHEDLENGADHRDSLNSAGVALVDEYKRQQKLQA